MIVELSFTGTAWNFSATERPYDAKYPGEAGAALRALCEELLDRIAAANE